MYDPEVVFEIADGKKCSLWYNIYNRGLTKTREKNVQDLRREYAELL